MFLYPQMSGYAWEIDPEDLDYGDGQRLGVGSYGGECVCVCVREHVCV